MRFEKRKTERRRVSYYLPVTEPGSTRLLGVVMDISPKGFRLDTGEKIPVGQIKRFFIHMPDEVAPRSARTFHGCSRWCRQDDIDSASFTVGYEFVYVSQDNARFFQRLFEEYGSSSGESRESNSADYIWR